MSGIDVVREIAEHGILYRCVVDQDHEHRVPPDHKRMADGWRPRCCGKTMEPITSKRTAPREIVTRECTCTTCREPCPERYVVDGVRDVCAACVEGDHL